ncbi:unnamed protein product [Rotaria sordida]|uniref:Uncharacterized protein n=1 Tax=Rotaria sordida TaxID=392033 RepID=A0A815AUJ1_9BILA|nr:unnamed protein product [Rotaria sordida]CAF1249853.1 unnamed protein product [Rotaria sordida]CAF1264550.1 unnamed protein product [Rotaria sordida]CAF1515037.1 unnamed protein product [Rotaria sordida]CAF4080710.1 unnamed protein product [Rotaria sordida]
MPPQLHDTTSTINTESSNISVNALPQRPNFLTQAITTNDTAQTINVYNDLNENVNEQQRRQRRIRQQQYHNTTDHNDKNYNRFAVLEQIDTSTDIESNYDDETNDDVLSIVEYDIADYNKKRTNEINKMIKIIIKKLNDEFI